MTMNETEDPDHLCPAEETVHTQETEITSRYGLHARPAARIAEIASKYAGRIVLSYDNRHADAKSIAEILGLGINCGDKIKITAYGSNSAAAAMEIAETVKSIGTKYVPAAEENNEPGVHSDNANDPKISDKIIGKAICPLPASGKAVFLKRKEIIYDENSSASPLVEKEKLEKALAYAKARFSEKIEKSDDDELKSIFKAHSAILDDPFLKSSYEQEINSGKTAQHAFAEAIKKSKNIIKSSPNSAIHSKIADYEDVLHSVLSALNNKDNNKQCEAEDVYEEGQFFPPEAIVITDVLLPGDINPGNKNICGIVSAYGSPVSHAALMLKELGIPSIFSAGPAILGIKDNSEISINAIPGEIIIHSDNQLPGKKESGKTARKDDKAYSEKKNPAITADGVKISVMANAGSKKEAETAAEHGAEGIGLLRTEFLFSGYENAPSEDLQAGVYSEIAAAQKGYSVVVRLFDAGNDKPLKFIRMPVEKNPALGARGIRAFSRNEKVFRSQIRSILRVNPEGAAKILVPLLTLPEEFAAIKKTIREEADALGVTKTETGAMIETPSAAIMADKFAKYADFISIGSNDLAQFANAADRLSDSNSLNDAMSPAMIRLFSIIIAGAAEYECPVSICGDMASDPEAVPLLIGLGLRKISVPLSSIPEIKHVIRRLNAKECEKLASDAMKLENSAAIRKIFSEYMKSCGKKNLKNSKTANQKKAVEDHEKTAAPSIICRILKGILLFFSRMIFWHKNAENEIFEQKE